MSTHVLLNLSNELGKELKCEVCRASLVSSIMQQHEC